MRKMIKKLVATAMLVTGIVATTVLVSADEMSGYVKSPKATAGCYAESAEYDLYDDSNTAIGADAYAYFASYGSLSSLFANATGREMLLYLMESDYSNADDIIKIYKGQFYNRNLLYISYVATDTADEMEGVGDHEAELYIKFKVQSLAADTGKEIPAGLFSFKLGID